MDNESITKQIRGILHGIDQTEVSDKQGWWATSSGAEFGKSKLDAVINFFSKIHTPVVSSSDVVYLVKSSTGQYDDYAWHINGIFTDPAQAETLKLKILSRIAEIKELKFPIEGMESYDDMPEDSSEADYEKVSDWMQIKNEADEFNWCRVEETKLNCKLK